MADEGFPTRKVQENLEARGGPTCSWMLDPAGTGGFDVAYVTGTPEGLSAIYRSNEKGDYDDWEVLDPIRGYPAVAADMNRDRRSRGDCIIAIGVRDDRIFTAGITDRRGGEPGSDPCGAAAEIAGMVIDTMAEGD